MYVYLSTLCVILSLSSLHGEIGTLTTVFNNNTGIKTPIVTNKNFVEVIKESLRRNNDDYSLKEPRDAKKPPAVDTRRLLNDSQSEASITRHGADIHPATPTPDTTAFRSVFKESFRKKKHDHISSRSHNIHRSKIMSKPSNTDKKSVDKWKVLLEKSNRLRKYTSSPKIEPSSATSVARIRNIMRTDSVTTTKETQKTNVASRPRPRKAYPVVLPVRTQGPNRNPPNADQLDMAPARGAYIHDLRLKSKFCYRHVLWPEGPKYNSKGETIMPAFNASWYHRKKKFFETAKPTLVLPRCCNCCKKSVLGCQ